MPSIISAGTTAGSAIALTGDTTGNLAFQTNGTTTAMTIDTSQRVGIGTASPSLPLDINTGGSGSVNINGTGSGPWMRWQLSGTAFAYIGSGAQLGAGSASDFCFNSQNNMTFTSGGNSERMRITSAGNVGIGTSSPSSKLVVSAATDQGIWVTDGTYTGTFNPTSLGGVAVGTNGAYPLILATNTTERMRVTSGGQLLVATTSGTMGGSGKSPFQRIANSTAALLGLEAVGTSAAYNMIVFNNSNGEVGVINTSGTGTSYGTTSDYRLKENVAPMTGALDKVAQLKPVTYTWKTDGSAGQGFIAHELQAVVPDCVTGEKDAVNENGTPQYQNVDTSFLVATLTAAIQELKAELDATKAEVAALKGVN